MKEKEKRTYEKRFINNIFVPKDVYPKARGEGKTLNLYITAMLLYACLRIKCKICMKNNQSQKNVLFIVILPRKKNISAVTVKLRECESFLAPKNQVNENSFKLSLILLFFLSFIYNMNEDE